MPGPFGVSEKVVLAMALESHQPMQPQRVPGDLYGIELNHQVLRIARRIDALERLNAKARQVDAHTGLLVEQFRGVINRGALILISPDLG